MDSSEGAHARTCMQSLEVGAVKHRDLLSLRSRTRYACLLIPTKKTSDLLKLLRISFVLGNPSFFFFTEAFIAQLASKSL